MTLTYGFYNSVNGDRKYDATQVGEVFDGLVTDGVFQGVGTEFKVTASGSQVLVGPGRAWFDKTWSKIDTNTTQSLPAASNLNPRIDTLVLVVDKRIEQRRNYLQWVQGVPSTSPQRPDLNPATGVKYYTIADVYRAKDSTSVTNANITKRVGTSTMPYAGNALIPQERWDIVSYKRSIVRGRYLGSSMTQAQKNAIKNGSFEGMYLGDYWRHDGVYWRIVDFDYWFGKQATYGSKTSRVNQHHVVIVPDDTSPLYSNTRPFTTPRKAANCGWDFSPNAKNRCVYIPNRSKPLFGNNGLLVRTTRWTTSLSTTRFAMNTKEAKVVGTPMTEQMLLGSLNLGLPNASNDVTQLALYKHGPRYVWMGQQQGLIRTYSPFWLANQYTVDNWTCHHDWLGASAHNPNDPAHTAVHQIRPVFGITGR